MKKEKIVATFPWIPVVLLILLLGSLTICSAALADDYDPQQAGNPLRIIAYVLHPVGVLLDYGLMRPAYWLVQKEPFKTIFGSEDPS
jgi:hypothetical protein